jgi:hypothetical protein
MTITSKQTVDATTIQANVVVVESVEVQSAPNPDAAAVGVDAAIFNFESEL